MAKTKRAPFRPLRSFTAEQALYLYFCQGCGQETISAVLEHEKITLYAKHGRIVVAIAHTSCWRKYVAQCEEKRRANV